MKNKCIKCVIFVLTALFVLSGCSADKIGVIIGKFTVNNEIDETSGVLIQNDKYILGYDNVVKGVYLEDKSTGIRFSSNPKITEKLSNDTFVHPQAQSDIYVDYVDEDGKTLMTAFSYISCITDGNVVCKKTDNGCRIIYYFNEEEFSIPVDYVLKKDGLSVSVTPSEITESKRKVLRVSLCPFMCSVKNDSDNSYLFIPSGCGAVVYPKTVSEVGNSYSQHLYGEDPTIEKWSKATEEQEAKLPVFGVKRGNVGVCAVINDGADSCKIDSTVGSSQCSYSSVYTTFDVRASSPVQVSMYGYLKKTVVYSDGVIPGKCNVCYYPLYGDFANYNGMANILRTKFGIDKLKQNENESPLNLVIYGGCLTKKSFFGIPYNSVYAATTLKDAEKIIDYFSSKTKSDITVLLKGFGTSGINIGEIGGGYSVSDNLGSSKQLKQLGEKCKKQNVNLYFDFDVVRQSDNSWFSFKKTAKSLNNQTVYQYDYGVALRDRLKDTRYSLLARNSLKDISKQLVKKTNKLNLYGVSFESLSNISYSDNNCNEYMVRNHMADDVTNIFDSIRKNGKHTASVNANFYAAKSADIIFETPAISNKNDAFSTDVPFYQMVFKGKVPITSSVINASFAGNNSLLQAIESGAGLTYGIYKDFDSHLTDSQYPVFTTGTFDDIKNDIASIVNSFQNYYKKVGNASIVKHTLISDDLRMTEFDNGVKVYVNYSSQDMTTADGTVKNNGWLIVG